METSNNKSNLPLCPKCKGTGNMIVTHGGECDCYYCNGTGYIQPYKGHVYVSNEDFTRLCLDRHDAIEQYCIIQELYSKAKMELETIKHELLLVKKEVDAFRHFYGVVSLELLPENDNAPMEEVLLALKQLVDDNDKHIRQTWALSDYICDKKYCNRGVITGDQSKL